MEVKESYSTFWCYNFFVIIYFTFTSISLNPILGSMEQWGKSYASYFVAKKEKNDEYQLGTIVENLDELVKG